MTKEEHDQLQEAVDLTVKATEILDALLEEHVDDALGDGLEIALEQLELATTQLMKLVSDVT